MTRDFGEGIFDMEFINSVNDQKDYQKGQKMAYDKIDSSSALESNKQKARAMVAKSRTLNQLIFGMTNFSLSHQGMKVVK